MPRITRLEGIIAPVLTPFDRNDRVDRAVLKAEVDFAIEECGVHGLMTVGTESSEFAHVSWPEKKLITQTVVEAARGRVPVVAGASATFLSETLDLAGHAKDVGAAAIVVTPPYVVATSPDETVDLFRRIAETVDIPIMVYNSPVLSFDMPLTLLKRIAEIPNVVAMKESTRHFAKIAMECIHLVPRWTLTTTIHVLVPTLLFGGHGCIVPVGPAKVGVTIYDLFKAGRVAEAVALQKRAFALSEGYVEDRRLATAYYKESLRLMGVDTGLPRAPFHNLGPGEAEQLKAAMRGLGLIG
ncbi:MAG: dihydrodipicolinate synthase family protein [Proteobacteria bacterium]|nr:dihydrodipicolinate synthase family protein [Pseudomonadota bacterium]